MHLGQQAFQLLGISDHQAYVRSRSGFPVGWDKRRRRDDALLASQRLVRPERPFGWSSIFRRRASLNVRYCIFRPVSLMNAPTAQRMTTTGAPPVSSAIDSISSSANGTPLNRMSKKMRCALSTSCLPLQRASRQYSSNARRRCRGLSWRPWPT